MNLLIQVVFYALYLLFALKFIEKRIRRYFYGKLSAFLRKKFVLPNKKCTFVKRFNMVVMDCHREFATAFLSKRDERCV